MIPRLWIVDKFELHVHLFLKILLPDPALILVFILVLKLPEVKDITGNAQIERRQAEIYLIDMDHAAKVLSMQEDEPEIQEAIEVVTTAKLITEVVAAISEIVSAAAVVHAVVTETYSAATIVPTITTAPVKLEAAGIVWSTHCCINNDSADYSCRKKIPTLEVYIGSDAEYSTAKSGRTE
nr:hypothetical protein [Tanacetum cinerariifolium]